MRIVNEALLLLALSGLAGCTTLSDSIEQRVKVSEQCRAAISGLSNDLQLPRSIASVTIGNLGNCSIAGEGRQLLALCSLNQISARYGLGYKVSEATYEQEFERFVSAKNELECKLENLVDQAERLDNQYQERLTSLGGTSYNQRTEWLREVQGSAGNIKSALDEVRKAHEKLHTAMIQLNLALEVNAKSELAAWDANFRMQLAQLERLLSGDFRLILQNSLRDQVITHVARRSLELLHGSLKPADAVLNRLDNKAYGAVSIGYLAFSPNIQKATNKAYDKLEAVYRERLEKAGKNKDESKLYTKIFLAEVQRAACENLVTGTQFSMLSELVDTMLIMKVSEQASDNSGHVTKGITLAQTSQAATPVATPFSVYTVNEWAARQHLLTQKISAKLAAKDKGAATDFPGIETIEESAVERVAAAATAKTVDDAVRLEPKMLTAANVDNNSYLISALNVTTAANAVSMASVALDVNISVSNSNTFTPNNQNIVAPVINIPSAAITEPLPALCEAIHSAIPGSTCIRDGAGYVVSFASRFGSDSCIPGDLEPSLTTLGQGLAKYRDRHGVRFNATVDGFASLPKAMLARCPAASAPPANCRFPNILLEPISIKGCSASMRDRNAILSAARARNTAATLEKAGEGAVIVRALTARGVEIASLREAGANPADDQTILIRLQPTPSF